MQTERPIIEKNGKKYFYRFSLNQRFQHILLFSTVITLVLTGMPLKFYDAEWAKPIYALFGGIEATPVVHKTAGVILLLLFVYHLGYVIYTFYVDQVAALIAAGKFRFSALIRLILAQPLIPRFKDVRDIIQLLKYLCFLSSERPRGDKFTWKEKFDYWAPFWGIVIIGSSGMIRWHKEFISRFVSGEIINYAVIAHGDEALLAALFLFIWHFYNVHYSTSVFPMGTVFLTGYLSEDLMIHEHYAHYVEIMKKAGRESEIRPFPGHEGVKSVPESRLARKAVADEQNVTPKERRSNVASASDLSRV